MILNFYLALNCATLTLYLTNLLTFHESLLTTYSNINDILSRLLINDFFLNSYYLFWTSFWYLPTFLIGSFSIALINYSKSSVGYVWLFVGLILIVTSIHYQNLNPYNYALDNCSTNFNVLLSNSVNKFHPALFYVTLFPLLIILQLCLMNLQYRFVSNLGLFSNLFINNSFLLIIIFTLFLGSWWALQEGSWGGWWNWDPSEVFGLLVLLYYLYTLHKSHKINNYSLWALYLKLVTHLVFVVYIFIQLNFDLVSHNFGTRVDQFVDTSQNFLIVTVISLFLILLNLYRLVKQLIRLLSDTPQYATHVKDFTSTWRTSLTLVLIFILLSSFSLLLNDFLWKLLSINVFNSTKFTYFYTSLLITVLLLRTWSFQLFITVTLLYVFWFSKEIIILLLIISVTKINLLHVSIVSLLFVMLSESNQSVSFWAILHENTVYVQTQLVYDVYHVYASLNNFMIEHSFNILVNSKTSESIWNFIWTSSSTESHGFLHSITPNTLSQSLYSGNGFSSYVINILDFCISTNNFLLILIFILMRVILKTHKLITS